MTLQFEDVVDCLIVLCPEFDFLFLFDHSQGNARKRDEALDAKNVEQLAKDLETADVSLQRGKHHSKLELHCFAEKNRIPLRISRPAVKYGWLGKPKGLPQVLWERGLIDATKLSA
jgi:hypothetical protein